MHWDGEPFFFFFFSFIVTGVYKRTTHDSPTQLFYADRYPNSSRQLTPMLQEPMYGWPRNVTRYRKFIVYAFRPYECRIGVIMVNSLFLCSPSLPNLDGFLLDLVTVCTELFCYMVACGYCRILIYIMSTIGVLTQLVGILMGGVWIGCWT